MSSTGPSPDPCSATQASPTATTAEGSGYAPTRSPFPRRETSSATISLGPSGGQPAPDGTPASGGSDLTRDHWTTAWPGSWIVESTGIPIWDQGPP